MYDHPVCIRMKRGGKWRNGYIIQAALGRGFTTCYTFAAMSVGGTDER